MKAGCDNERFPKIQKKKTYIIASSARSAVPLHLFGLRGQQAGRLKKQTTVTHPMKMEIMALRCSISSASDLTSCFLKLHWGPRWGVIRKVTHCSPRFRTTVEETYYLFNFKITN